MIFAMPWLAPLVVWIGLLVIPGPGLAPVGVASVRLPDPAQLVRAAKSGDDVEVERVAARLGAVRLERLAERGRREERLAALRGVALVEDGWAVLPELIRLCRDSDEAVAEAAAGAARRIVEAL